MAEHDPTRKDKPIRERAHPEEPIPERVHREEPIRETRYSATPVEPAREYAYGRPVPAERHPYGIRIAWGGVWAGLLIGFGVLLLLGALGLAIGITAADTAGARGLGIGAAVWGLLTLLVALFIGGMVASRTGLVYDRTTSLVQGSLVWVMSVLILVFLGTAGITTGVGGMFDGFGAVARGVLVPELGQVTTGDVDTMVERLNDPATAEMVVGTTGMPRNEAERRLGEIAGRVDAARDNPELAAARAREGMEEIALAAQPQAARVSWMTFLALVVSLVAAAGGAIYGARRLEERLAIP
jgi:hypothetical protein